MTSTHLPHDQQQLTETSQGNSPEGEQPFATLWIDDREILLYESNSDSPFFLTA